MVKSSTSQKSSTEVVTSTKDLKGVDTVDTNSNASVSSVVKSVKASVGGSEAIIPEDSRYFLLRVEETGWLEHIRVVIASSTVVAEKLSVEASGVLVHCSDGWDRTAQVPAASSFIAMNILSS